MITECNIAIAGAGAAGLMAAIFAAREAPGARVVAFDGAPRVGAKILIAGGGRCNVTHDEVHATDFNGNRNSIARVLRSFNVEATVDFFRELGVELKREEGGKLFPVTNRARTVLDALMAAATEAGVEIVPGTRIESISTSIPPGFLLNHKIRAARLIVATGGRSVPKTGSDGAGYDLVHRLGHTITETFPALVPLVAGGRGDKSWTTLSGTSIEAELLVVRSGGRVVHRHRGSFLFTHFGFSGPVVLDISRDWIAASPARLVANFLPGESFESLEEDLIAEGRRNAHATTASFLRRRLPDRLATFLAGEPVALGRLSKDQRRDLVRRVTESDLDIIRDRGFDYAEVTAGGVPLDEVVLSTMESRRCPSLYLAGEILDVDGKIGGYNFQWAWATGRLAGMAAGKAFR